MGTIDTAFSNKEYIKHFKRLYSITNHSKLRSFQYLLMQNGIVINKRLRQYKIKGDSCTFCDSEVETVMHLFCKCRYTKNFYEEAVKEINDMIPNCKMHNVLNDNDKDNIFNHITENPKEIENLLFLVAKNHV